MGILLGRGTSIAITALLHWPTIPSLPAIIAAVAVLVTVGIVFGYYPASKALALIQSQRCVTSRLLEGFAFSVITF